MARGAKWIATNLAAVRAVSNESQEKQRRARVSRFVADYYPVFAFKLNFVCDPTNGKQNIEEAQNFKIKFCNNAFFFAEVTCQATI
jgi:hypothetical protein